MVSPTDAEMQSKVAPFLALSLTVGVALAADPAAVQSRRASTAAPALAALAARNNLTSLMLDYEPKANVTALHAAQYAAFVRDLAAALHAVGVDLEMCVSSWGILTNFSLYASTGVDGMMSMASTYYGKSVTGNEGWVRKEQSGGVSPSQLRVGVGTTNAVYQKWDYAWTEAGFRSFLGWAKAQVRARKGVRGGGGL
jgi:hypothetical protein